MDEPTVPTEPEEEMPEEQEFLGVLKSSFYSTGKRTKGDRYREFRSVFMGSDEGKRVLYEILSLAKLSADLTEPFPAPVDTNRMLIHEGGRQLVNKIVTILHKEPNENKPVKGNNNPLTTH